METCTHTCTHANIDTHSTQTQMHTHTLQGPRGWVVHGVAGEGDFFFPQTP